MNRQYLLAEIGAHSYGISIHYVYRVFLSEEARQVSEFEYELKGGRAYNLNPLFQTQGGEYALLIWHEEHIGIIHAREVFAVKHTAGHRTYPIPRSWFRSHVDWIESVTFLEDGKPYFLINVPTLFSWYLLYLYPEPKGAS